MTRADPTRHPSSFRDPHGYVAEVDGALCRIVEPAGERDYGALLASGLYDELTGEGLLVRHDDMGVGAAALRSGQRLLRPEHIPVISYPGEWTFSQLRAAALLTLDLQDRALDRGLRLRDASAFNVQFVGRRPLFIDTLSFGTASDDGPWEAYRQFCENFLAPLALIAAHGHGVAASWASAIDGIGLPTASRMLSTSSWWRPGTLLHVHLHALAIGRGSASEAAATTVPTRGAGYGKRLVRSLRAAIEALRGAAEGRSAWMAYRGSNSYSVDDTQAKLEFVRACVRETRPARALDLGTNDGLYASELARIGVPVTAVDSDALCCDAVFSANPRDGAADVNVAWVDLANPTPSFGWAGEERSSFDRRFRCDLVLALALVHHLAITDRIPFEAIASWFAVLGRDLVVEHVPPGDPMVSRLRGGRQVGPDDQALGEPAFLDAFGAHFEVVRRSTTLAGGRVLFLMRRRTAGST